MGSDDCGEPAGGGAVRVSGVTTGLSVPGNHRLAAPAEATTAAPIRTGTMPVQAASVPPTSAPTGSVEVRTACRNAFTRPSRCVGVTSCRAVVMAMIQTVARSPNRIS